MSDTIAQIATTRPVAVKVFQRHGVDFCCGGQRPLDEACRAKGLDPDAILAEISAEEQRSQRTDRRWDDAPVGELVDHILAKHHRPLDEELPRLVMLARKVARVHGDHEPRLEILETLVIDLVEDLVPHMEKEEQILFPWILRGEGRTAAGPVQVMEEEHEQVGDILRRIRSITGDYDIPAQACGSWRALWTGLEALEADLHEHIHLENNVLFPRVLRGA
jgi:regulator of cell morphogenesis and NO signaling